MEENKLRKIITEMIMLTELELDEIAEITLTAIHQNKRWLRRKRVLNKDELKGQKALIRMVREDMDTLEEYMMEVLDV